MSEWITITARCSFTTVVDGELVTCGKEETNLFPAEGVRKWRSGMLIQQAMPEINSCLREFLLTGWCADCRAAFEQMSEEGEKE